MRDAVLGRGGSLTEGHLQLLRIEQRIVAKAAWPARGAGTGRPAERVHFDPGVIGHRGQAAARRVVARLGDRVLDVARAALEIGFFGQGLEEPVGGKRDLKRQAGEQLANLTRLPGAARADDQLHPPRSRPSSFVVDLSWTSGTRTTRPPHPSTSFAPTMASCA